MLSTYSMGWNATYGADKIRDPYWIMHQITVKNRFISLQLSFIVVFCYYIESLAQYIQIKFAYLFFN